MTTEAAIISRVRLEIGDQLTNFQSVVIGDGSTARYELPGAPVTAAGFSAFTVNTATTPPTTTTLNSGTDYTLDGADGVIVLNVPLAAGLQMSVQGTVSKYFTDTDLLTFVQTAELQHLHNRQGITLLTLPPVEEYPLALLAAVEALYALLNDATFDIDVSTPEGVGIPRSQRFRQLQEMIEIRKAQYLELCALLNVGLNRIEVFNLRRVSRTTGRLVPDYLSQELEDAQPPTRAFPTIDTDGADPIVDGVPVLDISTYEFGYYNETYTVVGGIPAGFIVDARIRRYKDSASLRQFLTTVIDPVAGTVTLTLGPNDTANLPTRLFYDIRLTNRTTREVRTLRRGVFTLIQQVGVDESFGQSSAGGYYY